MSGVFSTIPTTAGYPAEDLMLIELRVLTGLMMQLTNTADNNPQVLRNDEAPVLGLATPIPTA